MLEEMKKLVLKEKLFPWPLMGRVLQADEEMDGTESQCQSPEV